MGTVITVTALCLVAVVIAFVVQRKPAEAPSQPKEHTAPAQLDVADFGVSEEEWLVVLFSSTTCDSCVEMVGKVEPIRSDSVATFIADTEMHKELHKRYNITGVPVCVIADTSGVVRRSFVGPTSATHLWGALAELRDPGSVPPGCEA